MMLYICLTFLPCINKSDDDDDQEPINLMGSCDDAITIGVWDGGGKVLGRGEGGLQPHQFLATQIFGGGKRNLGKVSF